MTTVLTSEEIFLPTTRGPNKVVPFAVEAPIDMPYVIGKPYFSVQGWTPSDHYAGPVPNPGAATPAFARKTLKSNCARLTPDGNCRDFYAGAPADFWPCTRDSMDAVGMNRTLRVNPTFAGLGDGSGSALKVAAVAAGAGIVAFLVTRRVLRSR